MVHRQLRNPISLIWTCHVDHSSSFMPARRSALSTRRGTRTRTLQLAGQFPSFPGTTKIEFSLPTGYPSLFPAPILHSSLRALVTLEDCHDAPAAYGAMSVARSAALEFDGRRTQSGSPTSPLRGVLTHFPEVQKSDFRTSRDGARGPFQTQPQPHRNTSLPPGRMIGTTAIAPRFPDAQKSHFQNSRDPMPQRWNAPFGLWPSLPKSRQNTRPSRLGEMIWTASVTRAEYRRIMINDDLFNGDGPGPEMMR
ncbi:hypothetical protein DFP72DRAFT_904402 [Ephemerocybe angulata]|uniref:Uncharacterized protein n=1 Tax=Ephemerocybe angulata TaxID=980116 RepID=A0A8H6HVL3_9AGAR|nr:hypothetical protein DFP72DRAFT_904402 [Tulosesus angulatus]